MAQHFFLLGYGEYRTDNELAKRKKNTAKLFPFNIADVNYVAHFDTKIQSLKDYLGALESDKELVSPFVAAHKITYGDDKEPQVENTEFLRIWAQVSGSKYASEPAKWKEGGLWEVVPRMYRKSQWFGWLRNWGFGPTIYT